MSTQGDFEANSATEILQHAISQYGKDITFASSFGAEDVVLIDMLSRIEPNIDIFFLDTGLHFQETYDTIGRLEERYKRSFTSVKTSLTLDDQEQQYGPELWKREPDTCCNLRKVEPLQNYLRGFHAWITGIRRTQSPTRANAKKWEWDARFGLMKMNPLADWSDQQVWTYIFDHNVPYNPLHDHDFPSIGCAVCTKPVLAGEDLRSGRWGGFEKTECGLHR